MKLNQKGQSLIEIIIALGVVMIVTLGFTNITLTALRNSQHAKNQNQATRHTQEALEIIRVIRDLNYGVNVPTSGTVTQRWDDYVWEIGDTNTRCTQLGGSFPVNSSSTGYFLRTFNSGAGCTREQILTGANTETFWRTIRMTARAFNTNAPPTATEVEITVTVEWDDSKGTNSVEASTILSQWN